MKKQIKKWTLRLTVTGIVVASLLLIIILNPILTYANKTTQNNFTIYHNKPLDSSVIFKINESYEILKESEVYNENFKIDICLNDGSVYPRLIKVIRGQAFAWGFYNKVVLEGNANYNENYVELNGYKWNLTQLLAHEMIHCFQFDKFGIFKSKPFADIPNWKWEGYAEYVVRKNKDQKDLFKNIARLLKSEQQNANAWGINFEDGTSVSKQYYKDWNLVQYCMQVKKINYASLLSSTVEKEAIHKEMMMWFNNIKNYCN
jgi:hypothetical protein